MVHHMKQHMAQHMVRYIWLKLIFKLPYFKRPDHEFDHLLVEGAGMQRRTKL